MHLKLTDEEMQEVQTISASCTESVGRLYQRLEMLTWRDGLLEFRMQASVGILPWMEQLQVLSDRVNLRLQQSGIPLGPSLEVYEKWLARQNKPEI
ncbi:MAG: hypothetical protein ACO3EZ_07440 [Prochlorotrichaceae cyanobacterium]